MNVPSRKCFSVEPRTLRRFLELMLSDTDCWTRAELAKRLDVSLMTVGKVAERLLDIGVLCEKKLSGAQGGSGRRPCALNYNDFGELVLIDLGRDGHLIRMGIDGKILQNTRILCNDTMSPEDHWNKIVHQGMEWISCAEKHKTVVTGILLPEGQVTPPEAEPLLKNGACLATRDTLTRKELTSSRYGKTVLHLSMDRTVTVTLTVHGRIVSRTKREWQGQEKDALAADIAALCRFLTPRQIILERTASVAAEASGLVRAIRYATEKTGEVPSITVPRELSLAEQGMAELLKQELIERVMKRAIG